MNKARSNCYSFLRYPKGWGLLILFCGLAFMGLARTSPVTANTAERILPQQATTLPASIRAPQKTSTPSATPTVTATPSPATPVTPSPTATPNPTATPTGFLCKLGIEVDCIHHKAPFDRSEVRRKDGCTAKHITPCIAPHPLEQFVGDINLWFGKQLDWLASTIQDELDTVWMAIEPVRKVFSDPNAWAIFIFAYLFLFWFLALWGFRERIPAILNDPERHRDRQRYILNLLFEITLFLSTPVVAPTTCAVRALLLPVYLVAYGLAAVLGIFFSILAGSLISLLAGVGKAAKGLVALGKKLYQAVREVLYLDRLHKQITHTIDSSVQVFTLRKSFSHYFIEDGFLKVSAALQRSQDAAITLSTIIRDESHPAEQRKQALEGLCKLAENCLDCSPDTIETIQQTLLMVVQDSALKPAVRVHAARVLTNHALRPYGRGNPQIFEDEVICHAWKSLAMDSQVDPRIRIGAINMMRMRLKHPHRAENLLWTLFLDEVKKTQKANAELRVRAAARLQANLLQNGKHHHHHNDKMPLETLRQSTTCENCRAAEQYLAAFAIGYTLKAQQNETGPLLLRLAKMPQLDRPLRLKALAALRRFERKNALEELASRTDWNNGPNLEIRLMAARWLTSMDQDAALKAWQPIVENADIAIEQRIAAAEQALEIGAAYAHQFLLQMGTHRLERLRLKAALALAKANYVDEARSSLILLASEATLDRQVARQAFQALQTLP